MKKLLFILFLGTVGIYTQIELGQKNCLGFEVPTNSNSEFYQKIARQINESLSLVCSKTGSSNYWMWIRYANKAKEKSDYKTALIYYQRALAERPNDVYASTMVQVMKQSINNGEAARQQKDLLDAMN